MMTFFGRLPDKKEGCSFSFFPPPSSSLPSSPFVREIYAFRARDFPSTTSLIFLQATNHASLLSTGHFSSLRKLLGVPPPPP